jgi:hypothetical protein
VSFIVWDMQAVHHKCRAALGVVNAGIWETKAGGMGVWGQPGPQSETLYLKGMERKKKGKEKETKAT